MTKPNFFIIGGMKCGTTSLHNYLAQHPQIFMSEPKEPHYFVDAAAKEMGMDLNKYLSLFDAVTDEKVIGESTTSYTKIPRYHGVAEKIFSFNPESRLLYVIRNPIKRTISQYWYGVRGLKTAEIRPIMKALTKDDSYIAFSDYKRQIQPFIETFGREKIYIVTYEKLFKNLFEEVNKICVWLGVDEFDNDEIFRSKWNVTPEKFVQASGFGILNRIRNTKIWSRLSPLFPKSIKKIAIRKSLKPASKDQGQIDEAEKYLAEIFRPKKHELESYLNMSLKEWDI